MKTINLKKLVFVTLIVAPNTLLAQWGLSGNNISSGQFIGTTNNTTFEIKRNNQRIFLSETNNSFSLGLNNINVPFYSSNSINIGNDNSIGQNNSFAIGRYIQIDNPDLSLGENSFAIGSNISTMDPLPFFAIGNAIDPSSGGFVIGSGGSNSILESAGPNTLSIGLNSNLATLFIGQSNGFGTTGNVGIATTTPAQKLDINGGLKIGSTSTGTNGSLRYHNNDFEGYTDGTWVSLTNTGINDWARNGNHIYSSNLGNVGVGTSTPENAEGWDKVFNVNGNEHAKIIATTTVGGIQTGIWAHSLGFSGSLEGGRTGTSTNHAFSLITNNNVRMMISANGNIGISKNNPTEKLDINGAVKMNGFPLYFLADNTDPNYLIQSGAWNEGLNYKHFGGHRFYTQAGTEQMRISSSGLVGIGTSSPNYKLHVQGGAFVLSNNTGVNVFKVDDNGFVRARQVDVNLDVIPDYVFEKEYKLLTINQLEQYVTTQKHLPNIKSAGEYAQAGSINLGELNLKLLEKVEELSLYIIELNKRIDELEKLNSNK